MSDMTSPTSQVAALISRGKEQGYLTFAEVNDHLPDSITESEQIEDIIQMLNDVGIPVLDRADSVAWDGIHRADLLLTNGRGILSLCDIQRRQSVRADG